jgi:hypothetical protein
MTLSKAVILCAVGYVVLTGLNKGRIWINVLSRAVRGQNISR